MAGEHHQSALQCYRSLLFCLAWTSRVLEKWVVVWEQLSSAVLVEYSIPSCITPLILDCIISEGEDGWFLQHHQLCQPHWHSLIPKTAIMTAWPEVAASACIYTQLVCLCCSDPGIKHSGSSTRCSTISHYNLWPCRQRVGRCTCHEVKLPALLHLNQLIISVLPDGPA